MPPKRKTYIKNCTGDECDKKSDHSKLFRILFYFLFVIFISSSIYMLLFSAEMKVDHIEIIGTKSLDAQEIKTEVYAMLDGKIIGVLPRDNYLLIIESFIEKDLKAKYKKIRSVTAAKKFPNSITVTVDEHESLLVWCRDENDCYLLDEEGVAYNKADFNSPELVQNKLLRLTDQSRSSVVLGNNVIDRKYADYLILAKKELEKLGIGSEDFFSTPSKMADEIHAKSSSGFDIKFSTQFSLESAIGTLAVILKKELPKEKINELEYIDLRSEYKAFYKFKNSTPEENKEVEEEKEKEKEK